jgi:hypothetical protein
MNYYSTVVIGNALLLEPIVGQFFGLILGLDKPPGALTYIGGLATLGGLYI